MSEDKTRKRMVVEEVGVPSEPVEELKEKVEELQSVTEDITESVEKIEEMPVAPTPVTVPTTPEIKISSGPNPLVIIIPGLFLLGALLGGIIFYQKSLSSNPTPTPTPDTADNMATVTPTPVPTKVDLTKYPINIMNGSGISGQAGVVKDLLTTAGFTVSGTGNADTYDFTKTVIKAKADVPSVVLSQLSAALSKSYVVDTNQSLSASSPDEIQVIVGSTKAQ